MDACCGPSDGRQGISPDWLFEQALVRETGELVCDQVGVMLVSDEKDVVGIEQMAESLVCLLEQSLPCAEPVEELFGKFFSAYGPEPASYASAKDNTEVVGFLWHSFLFVKALPPYCKGGK